VTVFNLVHISDLHFGYRPEARVSGPEIAPVPSNRRSFFNTHDHKATQGVMREVGLYARRLQRSDDTLDGIIITGDLATIGFRIDLARALEFVRDDLLSLV
jgi:3',5'-cyclic AMP phosphodiesterase CpdA